jgi:4-aminobutyrate aminotransferase-like enzyme/Ser/Thr protein kinase RdoA (MazF antagonist)
VLGLGLPIELAPTPSVGCPVVADFRDWTEAGRARYNFGHMMPEARVAAPISAEEAADITEKIYGLKVLAQPLPGEYDDNFQVSTVDGRVFVLKAMHPAREESFVDMQCQALRHLAKKVPQLELPRVTPTKDGRLFAYCDASDGMRRIVWLLGFVQGTVFAAAKPHTPELLASFGKLLGEIDSALLDFSHPATKRELKWDSSKALWAREYLDFIKDESRRELAAKFLNLYEREALAKFPYLRRSVIYGDANDYNALITEVSGQSPRVSSVIDFGDMHFGLTVAEPAVAAAYAILGQPDPVAAAAAVVGGYHRALHLADDEIAAFFPLMAARLAVSVINSAHRQSLVPDDPYVTLTEGPAWEALGRLATIDPRAAEASFRAACTLPVAARRVAQKSYEDSLASRRKLLGANLSLSYDKPLKIVAGSRQFLYDDAGRAFLDVYNNVPLVGHSHPRVIQAIENQLRLLNTNTRYLHDNILRYAERLTKVLPQSLRVCYFVNSGSEANELAIRLARAHTGREDVLVLEHAYHGNTSTLIDVSPYKFDGPGGRGQKPWVHVAPLADDYRGPYRRGDPGIGNKYAAHILEILEKLRKEGRGIAAFLAETFPSVGGQIVFPENYLKEAYRHVRAAGGVCIADEVQVGFGRLGTHMWGFETQGAVPDIAVFGKPIGNAFPLAAVVTTREIAASFANGMEFFSTFGGNPVACAAGLAVLEVLEEEHLQKNALEVGSAWMEDLRSLQTKFALIGDVRGSGLFVGVDLVNDRASRAPATRQASYVVNRLRDLGILAGTDGPHHNVLKLRPPLIFSKSDIQVFGRALGKVLEEAPAQQK